VNHDASVRHRIPLALGACRQQERPHGRGKAEAVSLHIRSAQLRNTGVISAPVAHFQGVHSLIKYMIARIALANAEME
jgi:hypothetical protein